MEKMEKVFETQEELTGYITGKVKGGFICTVDLSMFYALFTNRCETSQKN